MRYGFEPRLSGVAALMISIAAVPGAVKAADPCFTTKTNQTAASAAAVAAGVSVVAANSSTSQLLESVGERREEQANSCPAGYVSVNGSCEPEAPMVAEASAPAADQAEPAQAASSSSGGGGGGGGASSSAGSGSGSAAKAAAESASAPKPKKVAKVSKPSSSAASEPSEPVQSAPVDQGPDTAGSVQRVAGVWAEGFGEYEELGGLTIGGVKGVKRDQTNTGFLSGMDRTFWTSSNGGVMVGALGGASYTGQKFSQTRTSQLQPTTFTFDCPECRDFGGPNNPGRASFEFDRRHNITSDVEQSSQGESVGLYGSAFHGGFFVDGLFKVDLLELRRQTTVVDRFERKADAQLSTLDPALQDAASVKNDGPVVVDGNTCIVRNVGQSEADAVIFSDPQSTTTTRIEKANYENYIFASNIGYRGDVDRNMGLWWEPSGSLTYIHTSFGGDGARMGLDDGDTLRLQGGARFGITRFVPSGGYVWTASIGAYAYSDVLVDGFVKDGSGIAPTSFDAEEGKLRGLGLLQLEATWLEGYTWYAEAQARGGEDLWAVGGKLGGRIEW